jgi:hypothetical protein
VHSADETATMSLKTSDGSCTVDDGGYIKATASLNYKLHLQGSVAGTCQPQVRNYLGNCVDLTFETQYVGYSDLKIDGTNVNPLTTAFMVTSFDSTVPTNTQNGVLWSTSVLGEHEYTSLTNATPTACGFATPFPADNQPLTVNALNCGPEFKHDSFGNITHLPQSSIEVYVPSTMSGLYGPVDDAITDWNAALAGTGIELSRTTTPCSGSGCIAVAQGTLVGKCAQTAMTTASNSGGEATNTTTITFTTGDGTIPTWTSADASRLQRTASHEFGHALGMDHPVHGTDCSAVGDAVMLDQVAPCDAATSGYVPVISDTLPVLNTVYGGGPETKCGF